MLHLVNENGIDYNYHGAKLVLMATGKGKEVQIQTPVTTMASRSKQAKKQQFPLELLPAVVLDKILGLLEPQDLRSFHQVSKAWQITLSSRSIIENRRVDLVNRIRRNKENIARDSSLDSATPSTKQTSEPRNHDGKPGSRSILSSRVQNSDNSNTRPPSSSNSSRRHSRSLSTPTSRFMQEFEAGKKLLKGQVLFRCPACRSPVASPVSAATSKGFQQVSDNTPKKSSTKAPSLCVTNDSGFESIEASADQISSLDRSVIGDTSIEEMSMSFIATPEPGARIAQYQVTPTEDDEVSSICSPNRRSNMEMESAKCPKCYHRFCCKCQCTEHPGKPCKEIDGGSISFMNDSSHLSSESHDKDVKVEKRKILRRLARI